MANVAAARELFWNNIIREILTSLSVLSARIGARRPSPTTPAAAPTTLAAESGGVGSVFEEDDDLENSGGPVLTSITSMADSASNAGEGEGQDQRALATRPSGPEALFDGRLAVITTLGQRIPIAEVSPVFACGVPGPGGKHWLSTAIECTVFEIRTPAGEVFTLPVHEIRAFHSLTDELMQKLVESSREEAGETAQEAPFGFAAFTSLARGSEGSGDPEHVYEPGYFGE
ncbi:MAG: hypothetical protein AB7Q00_05945 [Phycisphaerales bacterium]